MLQYHISFSNADLVGATLSGRRHDSQAPKHVCGDGSTAAVFTGADSATAPNAPQHSVKQGDSLTCWHKWGSEVGSEACAVPRVFMCCSIERPAVGPWA